VVLDLRAVRSVLASYRGAPIGARAFVAARFLIAPLGPLTEESRDLQGRMLSLGCGYGAVERYLAAINPKLEIEGIDLDGGKVALVNETAGASTRFLLIRGDATQIDYDLEFQAVLVCDALHHFPASTHAPLARAIATALEPGGVCIVKDLDVQPRWKYRWNLLHDRLVAGPEPITCRPPGEVAGLFADAGFAVERVQRTDRRFTPYAHYILRLRKC
jgi:SAM-dependent methyltransferase